MRILKPHFLIPAAIVCGALGLAVSSGAPVASATEAHVKTTETTAPVPKAAVGSGQDNLYSVVGDGVPEGASPGEVLYIQGCSTCHGINGQGGLDIGKGVVAPTLVGVGAAAVDFYLSTGRMPINYPVVQAPRKPAKYSQEQIDAITQYVSTTFGKGGPEIPEVDLSHADLAEGYEIFANNCAACHNSQGSGGALGRNYVAPAVSMATPVQIAEAVRTGPGSMPKFGHKTLDEHELNSLVAYVVGLKEETNDGGLPAGALGPFSEGFIAWLIGLGSLLAITRWIGTRV